MIQRSEIRRFVKVLAREFDPERVILFGSYALGNSTDDSDVDLLVIMEHDKKKNVEQAIDIDQRLNRSFPLDIIVKRPLEVRRRLALHDMFLVSVVKEGKVLYERNRCRMD